MARAVELRAERLCIAIEVVRGGRDALPQTQLRRAMDSLAQGGDAIVGGDGTLEAIDGGEIGFDGTAKAARERLLLRGDDRLLNRQRLALAVRGVPRPCLPLQLQTGEPVGLRLIVDEVQPWPSVPDPAERRELRPIRRRGELLLPRGAIACAIELLVFWTRAELLQGGARARRGRIQFRELERRVGFDRTPRQDPKPRERRRSGRPQFVDALAMLKDRRVDRRGFSGERRAFAHASVGLAEASFEAVDRRRQRADLLLHD